MRSFKSLLQLVKDIKDDVSDVLPAKVKTSVTVNPAVQRAYNKISASIPRIKVEIVKDNNSK